MVERDNHTRICTVVREVYGAAERAGVLPGDLVVWVNRANPREAPPLLANATEMEARNVRHGCDTQVFEHELR